MADTVYIGDPGLTQGSNSVDLDLLAEQYDSTAHPDHLVLGPGHWLHRESVLDSFRGEIQGYRRTCILFMLGRGEWHGDRRRTRIGGLPYWPEKLEWPLDRTNRPMDFVAQLDFREVVWPETLPGNILTIHCCCDGPNDWIGEGQSNELCLTWHQDDPSASLISADSSYANIESPGPYYGEPAIVTDYKLPIHVWDRISEDPHLMPEDFTTSGFKIGGFSPINEYNAEEVLEGIFEPVFLCSLASISLPNSQYQSLLPTKEGFERSSPAVLDFGNLSTLVIVYPKGNPNQPHWILYLP